MFSRTISRFLVVLICFFASSSRLAAQNHVPFVDQPLVPTAVAPGGAGFTLTVNGTGFVSGATVRWNGAARTTTFVSSSQLTAAIPASDIATAGTATITVVNPTPGGGPSNQVFFSVTNPTTNVAFQSGVPLAATLADEQLVAGDFTGTGKLDLILNWALRDSTGLIIKPGTITRWPGNGDGTFQSPVSLQVGSANASDQYFAYDVAIGDFNGDGKLDVIAVGRVNNPIGSSTLGTISVLLGNGDGTFQPVVNSTVSPTIDLIDTIRLGDVNGDGKLDLVARCVDQQTNAANLCVFLGNGDGTFNFAFSHGYPNIASQGGVASLVLGDFNSDGKLDVVVTVNPAYVSLLLGNGDGTFGADNLILETYARQAGTLVAADFIHHGKLDLVYYHDECANQGGGPCGGNLDYLAGNGNGTFQPPYTISGLPEPWNYNPPVVGDFNGDGTLDLAVNNQVFTLGSGTHKQYSLPQRVSLIGDFNRDGKLDLAGASNAQGQVNIFLQTAPAPDFNSSISPVYQTVVTGSTATYTVTITPVDGFTGTVQPSVSGLPAGTTASFNPPTVTGSGSTVLSITTSNSTPTGSYQLVGTLTSGSLSHSGGMTLNVGPAGTDFTDFTGTITPPYQNLAPGASGTNQIQVQPLNGFTGNVSFSLTGLPAGAAASFTPATVTGGSGSTTLTISTSASTPNGQYSLVLTSTSGAKTHSTTLVLNVNPSGTYFGDFTGSITPTSQTIKLGQAANFVISLQPLYGFHYDVQLFSSPLPVGFIASATLNPIPGGSGTSTATFQTDSRLQPGTYTITITGRALLPNANYLSHSGTITLTVTP